METIYIRDWIIEQTEKWRKIKSDVIAKLPECKDFLDKSYLVLTWNSGQVKIMNDQHGMPAAPSLGDILEGAKVEVRFPVINKQVIDEIMKHILVDHRRSYGIRVVIVGQMPTKILEGKEVRTMQPIKKFRQDNLEVAIWENHGSKDGKEYSFRSLSLTRTWKDKNLQPRRDVIRLRKADIAKVIELLTKAAQELG
jgi:hypothetical protein